MHCSAMLDMRSALDVYRSAILDVCSAPDVFAKANVVDIMNNGGLEDESSPDKSLLFLDV